MLVQVVMTMAVMKSDRNSTLQPKGVNHVIEAIRIFVGNKLIRRGVTDGNNVVLNGEGDLSSSSS